LVLPALGIWVLRGGRARRAGDGQENRAENQLLHEAGWYTKDGRGLSPGLHLFSLDGFEQRCRAAANRRTDQRALLAACEGSDTGSGTGRSADNERGLLPGALRFRADHARGRPAHRRIRHDVSRRDGSPRSDRTDHRKRPDVTSVAITHRGLPRFLRGRRPRTNHQREQCAHSHSRRADEVFTSHVYCGGTSSPPPPPYALSRGVPSPRAVRAGSLAKLVSCSHHITPTSVPEFSRFH